MTQDTTDNPVTIMTAALLPPPGVESPDPKGWSETINDQTVIDAVLEAECGTLIQEGASIEHIGASALAYAQKIEVIAAADQRSIDEYQRRIEYIRRKSALRIGWLQRRLGYLHTLAMDWMNNFGLKSHKMPGIGTYRWHAQPEFVDVSAWETLDDGQKMAIARGLSRTVQCQDNRDTKQTGDQESHQEWRQVPILCCVTQSRQVQVCSGRRTGMKQDSIQGKKEQLLLILQQQFGAPLHGAALCRTLDVRRIPFDMMINELRKEGHIICAGAEGYWIEDDLAKALAYAETLERRSYSIQAAAWGIRKGVATRELSQMMNGQTKK